MEMLKTAVWMDGKYISIQPKKKTQQPRQLIGVIIFSLD